MQEFIIYQDELIKGHLVNRLNVISSFNRKRLLKLCLDMLYCFSNKLEIRPQVFFSVITVLDIIFLIPTAMGGIYTADLHPDTPTNTETCANFSVITVSRCLSLLDKSPVSLVLYQRSLFFIRRKAEDFLKIFRDSALASQRGIEPPTPRLGEAPEGRF